MNLALHGLLAVLGLTGVEDDCARHAPVVSCDREYWSPSVQECMADPTAGGRLRVRVGPAVGDVQPPCERLLNAAVMVVSADDPAVQAAVREGGERFRAALRGGWRLEPHGPSRQLAATDAVCCDREYVVPTLPAGKYYVYASVPLNDKDGGFGMRALSGALPLIVGARPPGEVAVRAHAASLRLRDAGDMNGAAEEMSRAATLAPHDPAILIEYADILVVVGRVEEARLTAQRALDALARASTGDGYADFMITNTANEILGGNSAAPRE